MISSAIILAGGFGTRLQKAVPDLPKPMAPVKGKPFLSYLLDYLVNSGIQKVVLSVGYRHEAIVTCFGNRYKQIDLLYAVENEPLGTGGGIYKALDMLPGEDVMMLNGDTFFNINLIDFERFHLDFNPEITIALKPMKDFERYGTVAMNGHRISRFIEKQPCENGLINGGIYLISKGLKYKFPQPEKFSFESDLLQPNVNKMFMAGYIANGYFIDIGIPEDYERAQNELPQNLY